MNEPKKTWGGRRDGAGAKPLTDEARHARAMAREGITTQGGDPVEAMAEVLESISPRVAALRPDLAERFEVVAPVEHLARFARTFCAYNQLGEVGEDGPKLGDPFEFEEHEVEFLDEALVCDEAGRRRYKRAGLEIARKNRKTTLMAVLSLYFGSPADGEHRPLVVQAAGVKDQAGKLYDTTKAFIDDPQFGSRALKALFTAGLTQIKCPGIGGEIRRVAGDGDNNHSLDPHVVMADELHTWKTPKQRENWKALTTAQGGRLDPFIFFITTEGDGDDNELAALHERLDADENTEVERRRPGLTIYRNRIAGMLIYRYAAPEKVDGRPLKLSDLNEIKLANPAPWRTLERLAEDLADPMADTATKLRLYANKRAGKAGRWISDEAWLECEFPDMQIPSGSRIAVGVDGARTRDCTAVAWAWLNENGQAVVRCHVWACKAHKPHHTFVPGRLNNDQARDFIREVLMSEYDITGVFYDPRYFDDQGDDLADEDDLTTVELTQSDAPMREAWDQFYERIYEGEQPRLVHDGDTVLRGHVKNAVGTKAPRGWIVRKSNDDKPIDALAAAVMAVYGATKQVDAAEPFAEVW